MRIENRFASVSMAILLVTAAGCVPPAPGEVVDNDDNSAALVRARNPIPDRYIVVFRDDVMSRSGVEAVRDDIANEYEARVERTYRSALNGFAGEMSREQALALVHDPRVALVEEDGLVEASTTENNATWGLDRIDQTSLPLDGRYTYNDNAGAGVRVYVIDTGILSTHQEFTGRVLPGHDFVDNDSNPTDCNGHGTHVSGTAVGTTYGVAKAANVIAVRVLDCSGSGSNSGVIAGVDWVTANRVLPAVANMSLGGGASTALDQAVQRSIAAGVTYALAAGNDNANACNSSPSRTPEAITVGATTTNDARASFSNFGTCVDIFAPGQSITSSWYSSPSATNTISGTSMASPHVAGAAALYLGANPSATPQQVRDALVSNGVNGTISGVGTGSPNVLLNISFIGGGGPPPPPPPPPPPGNSFSYTGSNTNSAQQNTTNQSISLGAGDELTIGTCGLTGASFTGDTYLRLFGATGSQVASNDDACGGLGSQITYTAASAATVEIHAGCYSNTSCSGTVVWTVQTGTPPPPPPPPPPPGSFSYTGSNTNSAQRNTTDQTIALTAGQRLTIGTCGVSGSTFTGDTYLRLRNAAGSQVAVNDDACGGLGSQITYTATANGNYSIRAGCYANTSCSGTVAWTIQ